MAEAVTSKALAQEELRGESHGGAVRVTAGPVSCSSLDFDAPGVNRATLFKEESTRILECSR